MIEKRQNHTTLCNTLFFFRLLQPARFLLPCYPDPNHFFVFVGGKEYKVKRGRGACVSHRYRTVTVSRIRSQQLAERNESGWRAG